MEIFFGLLFVLAVFGLGVCAGWMFSLWRERPVLDGLIAESEQQRRELDQFMADTRRELVDIAAAARSRGVREG